MAIQSSPTPTACHLPRAPRARHMTLLPLAARQLPPVLHALLLRHGSPDEPRAGFPHRRRPPQPGRRRRRQTPGGCHPRVTPPPPPLLPSCDAPLRYLTPPAGISSTTSQTLSCPQSSQRRGTTTTPSPPQRAATSSTTTSWSAPLCRPHQPPHHTNARHRKDSFPQAVNISRLPLPCTQPLSRRHFPLTPNRRSEFSTTM